jgi:hypothetical protein
MFSVLWTWNQCDLGRLHGFASSIRPLTLRVTRSIVAPLCSKTLPTRDEVANDDVAVGSNARRPVPPFSGSRFWRKAPAPLGKALVYSFCFGTRAAKGGHLTTCGIYNVFEEYDDATATASQRRESGSGGWGTDWDFCGCVCAVPSTLYQWEVEPYA